MAMFEDKNPDCVSHGDTKIARQELTLRVLDELWKNNGNEPVSSIDICSCMDSEKDHNSTYAVLQSLNAIGFIETTIKTLDIISLTPEGQLYAESNLPEISVLMAIQQNAPRALTKNDLKELLSGNIVEIGLLAAFRKGWIKQLPTQHLVITDNPQDRFDSVILTTMKRAIDEETCQAISGYTSLDKFSSLIQSMGYTWDKATSEINELSRRKLITIKQMSYAMCTRGKEFNLTISRPILDLTRAILLSKSWKSKELKPYNFNAEGKRPRYGVIHPLMKTMAAMKRLLISLGFEEMNTSNHVESSFWCFDALYIPQDHTAREIQDTFFIQDPSKSRIDPEHATLAEAIAKVNTVGDYGSIGWRTAWDIDIAKQNILRTHTTACTSRFLRAMGQEYEKNKTIKRRMVFSIDRVFRNEHLDSTHLAEFHQIEGFIAGDDVSLADLIGVLKEFYFRIGIPEIRFKPTFNPYTEPSMEVFGYHKMLNKWIEVGNSGIFRPEVTRPMGLPDTFTVVAWGLSLERPTMIRHGISNIRELFGPGARMDD